MSLSTELESLYIPIIDGILSVSDLQTISAKRIRAGLQAKVDHDISANKEAITDLIMKRFDLVASNPPAKSSPPPIPSKPIVNGSSTTNGKRSSPGDSTTIQHPSKKHKASKSQTIEDLDREYAAKLQAEENGRARSTRGGGAKPRKVQSKKDKVTKKKRKSTAKVGTEDDSDLEESGGVKEKKEREKKGGFHKLMLLSPPLATLLGEDKLSRPQTVKKIWEHIKSHDLQDKSDKRLIICDEQMRAIFKQDKVHMFTMNKILGQNLYDVDEVASGTSKLAAPASASAPAPAPTVMAIKEELPRIRESSLESYDRSKPVYEFSPIGKQVESESSDIDGEGEIVEESEESEED